VLTGELYVTVEDNALPEDSRDVHRVLLTESWNRKDRVRYQRCVLRLREISGSVWIFCREFSDRERGIVAIDLVPTSRILEGLGVRERERERERERGRLEYTRQR